MSIPVVKTPAGSILQIVVDGKICLMNERFIDVAVPPDSGLYIKFEDPPAFSNVSVSEDPFMNGYIASLDCGSTSYVIHDTEDPVVFRCEKTAEATAASILDILNSDLEWGSVEVGA